MATTISGAGAHAAAAATDRIPASKAGVSGYLTPAKLLDYINDTNAVVNVKDPQFGATGDGSTNDYAAIQAAINYVQALSPRSGTIFFPPGNYNVGTSPLITEGKGINVIGCGPDHTKIRATGTNAAWTCDGLWRSRFEGIEFVQVGTRTAGGATFELDSNLSGDTIGIQGNTFSGCMFSADQLADYAVAICRTSTGNGQGSENLWKNCAYYGGLVATFITMGSNALQNTILGGNFAAHKKYAIYNQAGSINIYSVGFQSTYTDHLTNGCGDIGNIYTSGARMVIDGCRSESFVFLVTGSSSAPVVMRACNTSSIAGTGARANNTAYSTGQLYVGTTAAGRVKLYKVTTAGTTGGSEPTWPETGTVTDGTAVWTEQAFNVVSAGGELMAEGCRFTAGCVAGLGIYRRCSFGRFDAAAQLSGYASPELVDCYVSDVAGTTVGEEMTIEPGFAATAFSSSSSRINREYKVAGRALWDQTNNRLMVAVGATRTSNWVSVGPNDVGTTVTPS